eukprot:GEMP01114237.1.p1 GENE.GEMP01114237.1~~GEMP01114237.1.p1  ORF type:complete len:194 (+),score=29.07 GEMP01114237.1:50-631(+)
MTFTVLWLIVLAHALSACPCDKCHVRQIPAQRLNGEEISGRHLACASATPHCSCGQCVPNSLQRCVVKEVLGAVVLLQNAALELQRCPAPQPCDCWCHCPEIVYGEPVPPGIPPVAAVNPFQPPPPIPPAVPPPFFAGPPPAVGVPFNPSAPMFLQQPKSCPESAPCNCYCKCRPNVPSKFLQIKITSDFLQS